ncbi:MAG: (Z)-2-((N-methylformamido)methylene)-5-hydroxybutyrolactone dehydrogenase [Pseudonocardiales bacterium]|jgi:aldehyde dehydrogenase (NAD+)|nr:(Z)-2-((N-methylformamido)methylene)-5-hydroxybutyrolactone dehydrogenase [Pseudonocardiales bacterium]
MAHIQDLLPTEFHVIGGKAVVGGTGGQLPHVNPATGQSRQLELAGAAEVDAAVAAAREAFGVWSGLAPMARRYLLQQLANKLKERADDLAALSTWESGMPVAYSAVMAAHGPAEWFDYYAGWADKLNGEVIGAWNFNYTVPEPYGVVAAIVPFNGPVWEIGMKAAPALAAGNTVVIKPPELAPYSSILFGQLCLEAGIPPGVVNIVLAGPVGTEALVRHPGVDKISFTGSAATARKILASAAVNITPVVLELGGKSGVLICDDADVDSAVAAVAQYAIAQNAGQICTSPSRVLAQPGVYDEVVEKLAARAQSFTVGDPNAADTAVGPVISEGSAQRILGMIDSGTAAGDARLVTGGSRLGGALAGGAFVQPTVLADVAVDSALGREEIFGPVATVSRVGGDDEAVAVANGVSHGLAAYVFSRDISRCHQLARRLEAGSVSINGLGNHMIYSPFGGKKGSGYGREGGRAGIEEFLSIKSVSTELG